MNSKYLDYMKSHKWRRFREKVFARYGRKCMACGSRTNLEVHHLTYDRFGNEKVQDCIPLCHDCHLAVTKAYYKAGRKNLRSVTFKFIGAKHHERKMRGQGLQ